MIRKMGCPDCTPARPCHRHRILEIQAEMLERLTAARCPVCKCSGKACRIVFEDEAGEGLCVGAGKLGLDTCSACLPRAA